MEELKEFIRNLTTEQASELFIWLDENPNAVDELLDFIIMYHPSIQ